MVTPGRHAFSGALLACLVGAVGGIGVAPSAIPAAAAAAYAPTATADACPDTWAPLSGSPRDAGLDGNVSVLVGGGLRVTGAAAGAEGVVVARGDATFAREAPGAYEVGVTSTGSQVPPHPGSDMLVVGGRLTGDPETHVVVGRRLGGDVVVGGDVDPGTDLELPRGRLDAGVPGATAPYDDLLAGLTAKSDRYAALPATGSAEVTTTALTLIGDGTSDPQVFTLEGAALGADPSGGRSLQLLDVPAGAAVVVNLLGPSVDLDVDAVLAPDGAVVDPYADPLFAELATHLLWNAPSAATVSLGGLAQLPGSLLVPSAGSSTTLAGAGTNGRIVVAGDLVHAGAGRLHAYPLLPDDDLGCRGEVAHLGSITLALELEDPDHRLPDPDPAFQGRFECRLDGVDVTPEDGTWQLRAGTEPRVVSERVPVGAVCTLSERLQEPPTADWRWAEPQINPEEVQVAKRDPQGFRVVNRARALPLTTTPPDPVATATEPVAEPVAGVPGEAIPEASPGGPEPEFEPGPRPTRPPPPEPPATDADQADPPVAAPDPPPEGPAGPLATTAPLTLRGAFVWGPLLALSLLTMVLHVPRRARRRP